MKTATLLCVLLTFPASAAYAQAAGATTSTATQTEGSVQTVGHQGTAISQSTLAGADASATRNKATGAAAESSAATGEVGKTSAAATQASNVSAELTHKINSKNAKVGDDVVARTTSTAKLADRTKLPKGTHLMGKVTEVQPKSGSQHDGHLAFAFDRAVLHDGREIPIHTTLQSISAPASVAAMGGGSDDFAGAAGPVAAGGGGSARAGGGLLGGGGSIAVPRTGLVSGATSAVSSAPASVAGTTESTLHAGTGLVSQTAGQTAAAVSNLPGVTATGSASGSSVLDAKGSNVALSSGTQLMFSVAAP